MGLIRKNEMSAYISLYARHLSVQCRQGDPASEFMVEVGVVDSSSSSSYPWTAIIHVESISVLLRGETSAWFGGDPIAEDAVLPTKVAVGISVCMYRALALCQ